MTFRQDTVCIVYYYENNCSGDVVIPDCVEHDNGSCYPVVSIDPGGFANCTGLTSISIGSNVTYIGERAFSGCTGLTSVAINSDYIVNKSYDLSYSLKDIFGDQVTQYIIGDGVTSIGKQAFSMCTALTAVEISETVTTIGNYAFNYCIGLASVTLPNSLVSIGDGVFSQCHALTSITIPNNVTSIGSGVFTECLALSDVTIGSGVTGIGSYAFSMCTGLTSVTCLATTPPELGEAVFYDVDCSQIPLYVPQESIAAYQAADQWKEFTNILGIGDSGETKEKSVNVLYLNQEEEELHSESVTFHVPVAIILRAVYKANEQSAPAVVVNPSNPAQKLIRNGNVYILADDKSYTITGQEVK